MRSHREQCINCFLCDFIFFLVLDPIPANCRGDNSCKTVRLNIEQQNSRGVYFHKKIWESLDPI